MYKRQEYFGEDEALAEGFADDNPLAGSSSYEIRLNNITDQDGMVAYQMCIRDRVLEENGNIILKFASGKIRLSGEKAELLKKLGYVGKEVFTGVRPEKIVPAEDGKGEITGDILGSEEIEDATYIRFCVGENEFLAKASDGEKPSGKKMSFAVSGDDAVSYTHLDVYKRQQATRCPHCTSVLEDQ